MANLLLDLANKFGSDAKTFGISTGRLEVA